METYNDIYLRIRKTLRQAGIESADFDAKFIVANAAGKTREQLLMINTVYATDNSVVSKIEESLHRRLEGEPLAYILGEWEFYGLIFKVNQNVLIPRIDTEVLAGEAIRIVRSKVWKTRVMDLCTGSGCVGLAIAANVPACRVVMADSSEEALAVCRQNTLVNNLSRNTTVIEADALKEPPALIGAYDAIICNPPYIPAKDIEMLECGVKDYEPLLALDGGDDGLMFFRAIACKWSEILKPGGHLAFECGIGQADELKYIMRENRFTDIKTLKDTQKIERVVTGMKKN